MPATGLRPTRFAGLDALQRGAGQACPEEPGCPPVQAHGAIQLSSLCCMLRSTMYRDGLSDLYLSKDW